LIRDTKIPSIKYPKMDSIITNFGKLIDIFPILKKDMVEYIKASYILLI
jgi:hypothetical protein